jgi:hypothetical protein
LLHIKTIARRRRRLMMVWNSDIDDGHDGDDEISFDGWMNGRKNGWTENTLILDDVCFLLQMMMMVFSIAIVARRRR